MRVKVVDDFIDVNVVGDFLLVWVKIADDFN